MALDQLALQNGILDAFNSTQTQNKSSSDTASALAAAIVEYASAAEIMLLPGPMMIPSTPPVVSIAQGTTVKVDSNIASTGQSALEAAFKASFDAGDPIMAIAATGIVAYTAASFTLFSAAGHSATGVTVMATPPDLGTAMDAGKSGSVTDTAIAMASAIHLSFTVSVFSGAGIGIDGGLGSVIGQMLT